MTEYGYRARQEPHSLWDHLHRSRDNFHRFPLFRRILTRLAAILWPEITNNLNHRRNNIELFRNLFPILLKGLPQWQVFSRSSISWMISTRGLQAEADLLSCGGCKISPPSFPARLFLMPVPVPAPAYQRAAAAASSLHTGSFHFFCRTAYRIDAAPVREADGLSPHLR